MQPQQKNITANELYGNGWTINQAAQELQRTTHHVAAVIRGDRKSQKLTKMLMALPYRELRFDRKPKKGH